MKFNAKTCEDHIESQVNINNNANKENHINIKISGVE
jgi:hypothetical protein